MKKIALVMFTAVVLCFCGTVMGQEQPTPADTQQQPQMQAEPQQEYMPQQEYAMPMQYAQSGPTPIWVIQKRWFGFGHKYRAKPGWLNTGSVQAAPMMVQAAPPVIIQRVMVPQTVTRQVMVPQTVTRQVMVPQTVTEQVMVPQTVTEQVMVPAQIQRVPKPVVTWTPQVQWRY